MQTSQIQWTQTTWNPTRGCTKIGEGCRHCYAETLANRFRGIPGHAYEQGFTPRLAPHKLMEPLSLSMPKRIFVNSMSDLFHDAFPDDYIARVADVMASCPWHTFQVLTKRPERMRELLNVRLRATARLPHIWWRTSVENVRQGVPRIAHLQATNVAVRFLSVEPLLERLGVLPLAGIHWAIVGGESGPAARPMNADWVREIRDQCVTAHVPFFFKQWGGRNKKVAGRELDGRTWDEMPAQSRITIPSRRDRCLIIKNLQAGWEPNEGELTTNPQVMPELVGQM